MSLFKEFEVEVEEFTFPGMEGAEDLDQVREYRFQPLSYVETDPALLAEARGILKEARDKAQYIERQAYEEGFQQGQKDGREVGQRSMEQLVQQFQDLVNALIQDREELYRQREQDLVNLVLLISRKIVVRELRPVYTILQAAQELGVSDRSIYNWIDDGFINVIKLGRCTRILGSELARLLNEGGIA